MVAIICIVINMIIAWVFIWDAGSAARDLKNTGEVLGFWVEYTRHLSNRINQLEQTISRKKQKRVKGKFSR